MQNTLQRFLSEESGATSIEYGMIATLISIFIIVALNYFADSLNGLWNNVSTTIDAAID